ncbi:MAG: AmmeMemoRadiSam system radical SAM enzyme [Candidatus Riflebacteria bacterium]|nr:AmmeMemoRadiSam system radical SAM enzyme [Candidatus Riflebacteria bacterium]
MKLDRRSFLRLCGGVCAAGGLPLPSSFALGSQNGLPPAVPAKHYERLPDGSTRCRLCPNECLRSNGERSHCRARETRDGSLFSLVYGSPCVLSIDPLEKCPLFHFRKGGNGLSIATAGCNLSCQYCQNWQFSQKPPEETKNMSLTPKQVVEKAREYQAHTIAFFYTEPTIAFEYVRDIAEAAQAAGLMTVMVTGGFIQEAPLRELLPLMNAFTVGLKGFTEEYYRDVVGGLLPPVLRTIEIIAKAGRHLELVTLVVPTLNDNITTIRAEADWIVKTIGHDVPLHVSRFVPQFKLKRLPPTPVETLSAARKTALEAGIKFVYTGNIPGHEGNHTYCPKCSSRLIERLGFQILNNHLVSGACPNCKTRIPGFWE